MSANTRAKVFMRDRLRCRYCGKALLLPHETDNKSVMATIDHVKPKSKGGSNAIHNLVTACGSCNSLKGNKKRPEYRYPVADNRDREEDSRRARQLAREIVIAKIGPPVDVFE